MTPDVHRFSDDGRIPNSALPVLVYHDVEAVAAGAGSCEELFAGNGWGGSWRDGSYSFHHFHSTAHEVLGIAAGTATVVANIARVELPDRDPVLGADGPLVELWRGA